MGIETTDNLTDRLVVARVEADLWPHIEGKRLDADDIGRWVTYVHQHGLQERGRLTSFRATGHVFVRFKGPQGELCRPGKLIWG